MLPPRLQASQDIDIFRQRACMSGQSFKRFSVFTSICLAALSLTVGAITALRPLEPTTLKCECLAATFCAGYLPCLASLLFSYNDRLSYPALQVLNIILNSASITLSAITSLDWRTEVEQETKFAKQLLQLVNVHHDGKISLKGRRHHV